MVQPLGSGLRLELRRILLVVLACTACACAASLHADKAYASNAFGYFCQQHVTDPLTYCHTRYTYYADDIWSLKIYHVSLENCAAGFDSNGNMYYNPVCSSDPNVDPHHTYYGAVPLKGGSGAGFHVITLSGLMFWCTPGPGPC